MSSPSNARGTSHGLVGEPRVEETSARACRSAAPSTHDCRDERGQQARNTDINFWGILPLKLSKAIVRRQDNCRGCRVQLLRKT